MDGGGGQDPRTTALTAATFVGFVNGPGCALVAVSGNHCPACASFAPVLEAAARATPEVRFGRVNADTDGDLLPALSVTSVPTLMVFRDGILLLSRPGVLPLNVLQGLLDKVAGLDMDQVRRTAV